MPLLTLLGQLPCADSGRPRLEGRAARNILRHVPGHAESSVPRNNLRTGL